MTQLQLLKKIRLKEKELKEKVDDLLENEEMSFFDAYIQQNRFIGVENISKLDPTDTLIASISSYLEESEEKDSVFFSLRHYIYLFDGLLNMDDKYFLPKLLDLCDELKDNGTIKDVISCLEDENKIRGEANLKAILQQKPLEDKTTFLKELVELSKLKSYDVSMFMNLYDDLDQIFIEGISLLLDIRLYKEAVQAVENDFEINSSSNKCIKLLKNKYYSSIEDKELNEKLMSIRKYYEKISDINRRQLRNSKKDLNLYVKLEETILTIMNKEEIKDPEKIISKIPDENIRMETLKLIYEHNKQYYNNLKTKYKKLSKNSMLQYNIILKKYELENIEIETIMHNSVEEIEDILKKLNSIELNDLEIKKIVLQETDKNTFDIIYSLIKQGIILPTLVIENLKIFDKTSDEYNNLIDNLEMFKENNFNPRCLSNNQNILLQDQELLNKNINILKEYNLEKLLKQGFDYKFLLNEKLDESLDKILELGLEKYLENDLDILNYTNKLPRLYILKKLNIPITTKEELMKVLTSEEFIVLDEEINNYVELIPVLDKIDAEFDIEKLYNDSKKTLRTIELNGIIFSKNKIKRNYETAENIENREIYSLLNGVMMTEEDYNKLTESIKTLTRK